MSWFSFYPLVLLAALVLDALIGDPPVRLHPVRLLGGGIDYLWRKRPQGGNRFLLLWGVLICLAGLATVIVLTLPLHVFARNSVGWRGMAAVLMSAFCLKFSLSARGLFHEALKVRRALETGDLPLARRLTERNLVSRSLVDADSAAICSAVIESLNENFVDSIASPILFFCVGGLPAAWAYRFINTADAMLGYRHGDREWGGKCAARLDDALNWIPARLCGALLALSAMLPGWNGQQSLLIMKRDASRCSSPNSGWPMAAAAGALGIRLEKAGHYIINPEGRLPQPKDIQKGILLISTALCLLIVLIILPVILYYGYL
ncbi:MAG: cobalamin biosynthesis protein CobD [Spirochaeta sp. LUC14_002_19_P3]|nr:MAG: cobalamin biosynthesis protein CobD [Spirochaeta sp. LUC14_002_19_P3]